MKYEGPRGFHADAPAAVIEGRREPRFGWADRIPWLFLLVAVLPTLTAAIYYFLIAAPLYVSDARFVVRSRNQPPPAALGSMLESVGVSLGEGETDAFEVQAYMQSRDAVQDLSRQDDLRAMLARPEADFIERFPEPFQSDSFETLFKAYKRFVTVGYDSQTGISTLRIKAFRAADAQRMADTLLDSSEALINRLNDRAMRDAVAQAERQVEEARDMGAEAQAQLTAFRNHERLIDPDRSSVVGLDLLGKLETQLATMRAERAGLAASAPQSPQLPVLDRRIAAFAAQLDAERSRSAGEADSLAPKVGEYERLTLNRDLAVKTLEQSVSALEMARVEARRKQLYLQRVVPPNLPDKAEEPKRLLTVFTVLISALVAFAILSLIVAGFREHRQQ
jgi:BexC/CtrB/KpsE family polysaccharide export inner-membrane protein